MIYGGSDEYVIPTNYPDEQFDSTPQNLIVQPNGFGRLACLQGVCLAGTNDFQIAITQGYIAIFVGLTHDGESPNSPIVYQLYDYQPYQVTYSYSSSLDRLYLHQGVLKIEDRLSRQYQAEQCLNVMLIWADESTALGCIYLPPTV